LQVDCPNCSQRVVVDDAKAPDRPFNVKCPKCQAIVKFPGRAPGASAPPATAAPSAAAAPANPVSGAASSLAQPARPTDAETMNRMQRQLRGKSVGPAPGQVLVALSNNAQAQTLTAPLRHLGYDIDTLDRPEEGGRLLDEGFYEVVITNKTAGVPGKSESLYQRLIRLTPDARRSVFLVLVGEEFKTGDGTQAFAAQADLVVGPDSTDVDSILLNTMAERTRLFQVYLDARRRFEEAAS
jgi:predicted Zn finger-like uncharacterized protein